mmetsp:Transcript_18837/g.33463  ORF Transcript_18837/g.33463 Transcript_18837/m.33463 type:complete len:105 (+) Transcript_18837:217-531(+)
MIPGEVPSYLNNRNKRRPCSATGRAEARRGKKARGRHWHMGCPRGWSRPSSGLAEMKQWLLHLYSGSSSSDTPSLSVARGNREAKGLTLGGYLLQKASSSPMYL